LPSATKISPRWGWEPEEIIQEIDSYLKIINFIGEQLRRSDIFVAVSAAEDKNAVGVAFCLISAQKETALLLEELL
jgi:hypothetical protein